MKVYHAFSGVGGTGEVIVIPSVTPNPSQQEIGVRVGKKTVWLRPMEAKALAAQIKKEAE